MQVKDKVRAGAVPAHKFIIRKQLTKRPEDYPDAQNQPHVQVAVRRRAAHKGSGYMPVRPASAFLHGLPVWSVVSRCSASRFP